MDSYLKKKIKYKVNTVIICMILFAFFVVLSMFLPENKPKYYDTVEETFDVVFLTENNISDKENYTKTMDEYSLLIQDLNSSISNIVSVINLTNDDENNMVADISFSQLKESFPNIKDDVLKAELFKRGYLTKDDKIFTVEKDFDKYNSYKYPTSFYSIDMQKLNSSGVNAEEIERYFKVTKMKDNIILLCDDEYASLDLNYAPKTIYVMGKTTEDEIMIYGEYPLRLDVFDNSFMNL